MRHLQRRRRGRAAPRAQELGRSIRERNQTREEGVVGVLYTSPPPKRLRDDDTTAYASCAGRASCILKKKTTNMTNGNVTNMKIRCQVKYFGSSHHTSSTPEVPRWHVNKGKLDTKQFSLIKEQLYFIYVCFFNG